MEKLLEGSSDDYYFVGKILSAHGIHGEVTVRVWTDRLDRFEAGQRLWSFSKGIKTQLVVNKVRQGTRGLLVQFEELRSREEAKLLTGAELAILKTECGDNQKESWHVSEVIDCLVFTENNQELGRIVEIISQPHHDVYVIQGPYGEILLPVVQEFIQLFDLENHRLVVQHLEAFWDGSLS
jgi:16S rRNA processing protein RimM